MRAGRTGGFSFRPKRPLLVLGAAALSGGIFPFLEAFGAGLLNVFLIMLALGTAGTLVVVGCSDAWSSRLRGGGVSILAGALVLASLVAGVRMSWPARRWAVVRMIERMEPLVAAIEAYEAQHGSPPPSLDALVPEHIDEVPWTGLVTYPSVRYFSFDEEEVEQQLIYDVGPMDEGFWVGRSEIPGMASNRAILRVTIVNDVAVRVDQEGSALDDSCPPFGMTSWKKGPETRKASVCDLVRGRLLEDKTASEVASYLGPPDLVLSSLRPRWELMVSCGRAPSNFDRIFYRRGQQYPERVGTNRVERIGAWLYVHE